MALVALFLITIDLLLVRVVKKSFSIFNFIRNKIVFNFLVKLMIENSLYLMIFSMINLQYLDFSTPSKIVSYVFALAYVLLNSSIAVATIMVIYSKQNSDLDVLKNTIAEYPRVEILFFQIKLQRSTLIFYPIYIIRTMCVSLIYIIMQHYQTFQMFSQIFLTIAFAAYIGRVQPYSIKALNVLEIMNEITILACQYYMIVFSDYVQMSTLVDTIEFKYTQGKYLTYLIGIGMVFKLLSVIISQAYLIWPALQKLYTLIRPRISTMISKFGQMLKSRKIQKHVGSQDAFKQSLSQSMQQNRQNQNLSDRIPSNTSVFKESMEGEPENFNDSVFVESDYDKTQID